MEENKGPEVTVRRLTKEEEEEELRKQMELEYHREQLRQVKRERTLRARTVYSSRKKRGLAAIAVTAVIFIIAVVIQILITMQIVDVKIGTVITAVLAILSLAAIKILNTNRTGKQKNRRQE